jgi:hypothetical protein
MCVIAVLTALMAQPPGGVALAAGDVVGDQGGPAAGREGLSPTRAPSAVRVDLGRVERDLKILRARHFRSTRNAEVRAIGEAKLREHRDPAVFPLLIEVFGDEEPAVQGMLVRHFEALRSVEADVALARCAVLARSATLRGPAAAALARRYDQAQHPVAPVPTVVQRVIADGLESRSTESVVAAAGLCDVLNLVEAIPALIQTQAGGSGGFAAGSRPPNGDALPSIAYIVVGQQQAYVSDLQPVIADSAVGFNPTVSVLNTGTVMRIIDAHVITYRTDVLSSLASLASRHWGGRSVEHLGSSPRAWAAWYRDEFVPYRAGLAGAVRTQPARP